MTTQEINIMKRSNVGTKKSVYVIYTFWTDEEVNDTHLHKICMYI